MRGVDRCGLAAVALLLACLACPCFSEKDPWANDKDTVLIHASNFTEIVSKEKLIMVEFFTPWCGHCRQFAPEYAKAATELKKDGIVLAKVNCDDTANHPLAGKYGVRGFPTIRIFKKQFDSEDKELGTVENFEGERNYQTTVDHMRELASAPKEVDAEELEELYLTKAKSNAAQVSVVVLGLFPDPESEAAKAFMDVPFGRKKPPVYAWTKDAKVAGKFLPLGFDQKEAIVVITKFLDDPKGPNYVMPNKDITNPLKIAEFVDVYGSPLVWQYSNELSPTITSGRLQKFVWAFVDKESQYWDGYQEALINVARKTRGKMKYVMVEKQFEPLLQFFNIDKDSLPQVLLIDLHPAVGQRQFKYGVFDKKKKEWDTSSATKLDTKALQNFIASYQAGELQRFLRSEPVPEKQEGPILNVVGNTFEETIESDKDVLLMMYGDYSWCEHCKIYAPEYELIAKKFQKASKITIAQMNFGHNDIEDAKARGIAPKGFPELLLFRAGEHKQPPIVFDPKKYNDERGVPAVSKFLQQHVSNSFEVEGEKYGGKKRTEL